jgi:hypothetical protein
MMAAPEEVSQSAGEQNTAIVHMQQALHALHLPATLCGWDD